MNGYEKKTNLGKISLFGASESDDFVGAALVHPSLGDCGSQNLKAPVLCLPSKDDADMIPFMDTLKEANPEAYAQSSHHRFDDVHHGFAAARGDWSNELQATRANEAIRYVVSFFKKVSRK